MDHPLVGQTLERRYEVGAVLRRSAAGEVLRAFDRMLQREVAIQLFPSPDADASRRFHQGARLAARARHPNLLEIHDTLRLEGTDGVVFEPSDGSSLYDRVRAAGPLPAAQGVEMLRQAAAGLGAGHRWGLVHGALDPDGLILSPAAAGVPFRTAVAGLGLGGAPRPAFAAPEVKDGGAPTPASDVYSLAALGVFALAGSPPDASGDGMPSLPPGVSPELAAVLQRGLAPRAANRFPDMDSFAAALAAAPAQPWSTEAGAPRQRRGLPPAAVLALLVVVPLAAYAYFSARERPAEELTEAPPPAAGEASTPPPAPGPAGPRDLELSEVAEEPVPLNADELVDRLGRSYPPLLRDAGVTGRVVVRFAIDTDGRPDPETLEITSSTNPAFDAPTLAAVRHLRFSPARVGGEPVRVRVELPIQWAVSP